LKALLQPFYILSAVEVECGEGNRAVVVFFPFRLITEANQVKKNLIEELEAKLSRHVNFMAQRRILPKPRKTNKVAQQKRPYSRTLTSVHIAMLDDICYPGEIIDKRIRVRTDGKKAYFATLDAKHENDVAHKLQTFSAVYKKLTGKSVTFKFPQH